MSKKIVLAKAMVSLMALWGLNCAGAENKLVTYQVLGKAVYSHHNDDYTVRVRTPGGDWQDVYEYNVKVDLDNPQNASMAYFDMQGEVEVSISKNNGDFRRVEIRPAINAIKPKIKANKVTFTLKKPQNLSIEFDGDRLHNLHLFANPLLTDIPRQDDPNVIWFGPGVHLPLPADKGVFPIASNKTVYIDGSAILQGKILIDHATNVKITGRGVIDQGERGFEITNSDHVEIDGPVVINPKHYTVYCGQSHNLKIHNIKSFSAAPWTDGIDMMSCADVDISGIFLRTSDDAIAIYGHRWDYYGDARNISVSDSVLWADVAHPINIGLHGSDKQPELIQNLRFSNIDILGHDEDDRNYQGALAISNGDDNLVKDVLFENIRIDGAEEGMLFNFRVVYNEKYSYSPGRGIENVTLRNISVSHSELNPSVISGYDQQRMVKNIVLENVRVDGKRLKAGDFDTGNYVENVRVKP